MSDKIVTEIDLALNLQSQLSILQQLTGEFKKMVDFSAQLEDNIDIFGSSLAAIADQGANVTNFLKNAQLGAKGTTGSVVNTAAGSAVKSNIRGTETAVAADVSNTQLATQNKIATVQEKTNQLKQTQAKIEQGIVDLDTLAYQKIQLRNQAAETELAIAKSTGSVHAENLNLLQAQLHEIQQIDLAEQKLRDTQALDRASTRAQPAQNTQRQKDIDAAYKQQAQQDAELSQLQIQQNKQLQEEIAGENAVAAANRKAAIEGEAAERIAASKEYWAQEAAFSKIYEDAQRANIKFDADARAAAARADATASTPQALNRAGGQAFAEADALRKIKADIVDLDTLAYQREQAQIEVGALLRAQLTAQAGDQAAINAQLEEQYTILRNIDAEETEFQSHARANNIFSTNGADLLKIQAQLLVNYGLLNTVLESIRFGATFVKDLDEQFHELQAIGAITDTEMVSLSADILQIGQNSKFSAVEIAKASVVLAQAGLSGSQIKDSLQAIVTLATASGSSLADAAQNVTTVLNVFNYQASQTGQIANIMTGALNQSKLTMEQLTQGIAYASNTAANAGVSFTELVATFGVLADAGIKSGSTLGTGYRKLITDLVTPTEKFRAKVADLGLNLSDLDVSSNGVTGVLTKLHDAGFTAADAMQTLDIRASAVAIPLLKSADTIGIFEQRLYLSEAAVQANATQMESLSSSLNKLQNAFGGLIFNTFDNWAKTLASITTGIANLINGLGSLQPVVSLAIQALTVLAGTAIVVQLVKLITSLSGLGTAIDFVRGLVAALVVELGPLAVIIGGVALGAGLLALKIFGTGDSLSGLNKQADEAQAKLATLRGEMEASASKNQQLSEYIADLIKKHAELGSNSEALKAKILEGASAFNGMGTEVLQLGDDIDTLIAKAQKLHEQNLGTELAKTQAFVGQTAVTQALSQKQIDEQIKTQPTEIDAAINQRRITQSFSDSRDTANPVTDLGVKISSALAANPTFEQIKDLIGQVALADATAITANNKTDQTFLTLLDTVLQKRVASVGTKDISDIDLAAGQAREAGLQYGKDFGKGVTTFLNSQNATKDLADQQFSTGKDASGQVVEGSSASAIKSLQDAAAAIKNDIKTRESTPSFDSSFEDSPQYKEESKALADLQSDIAAKVALQDKALDSIGALDDKLLQTKIGTLESEIKVSNAARARELADAAEADADKIRNEKKRSAEAFVNSSAFKTSDLVAGLDQHSPAFQDIKNKTLQTKNDEADEEFNKLKSNLENAILQKQTTSTISANKPITTDIDDLRTSIRTTNTAYKEQIEAINNSTSSLQAHRAAQDLPENAPFVTDAQRAKTDQEIERADAAKANALANTLAAELATQQADLATAENLAGITYAAAKKAQEAAVENGGSPDGRIASAQFGEDKSEHGKAVATVLKQGDAVAGTKKSYDAAAQAAAKYNEQISHSSSALDTFSDTFELFQTKSFYGARAMGQDFLTMFNDIQTGFASTVTSFINGTKSIGQSFRDLGNQILTTLENIAVKSATQSLFSSLFGTPAGLSSESSPATPGLFSQAFKLLGFSSGGLVQGGTAGRDSVPIIAMPDEFILNKKATSAIGVSTLNSLNNGNLNVSNASSQVVNSSGGSGTGKTTMNVYVVSPDQVPGLGPNDVVAVVSDNIARGGSLKSLIKSVVV